MGCRARVLTWGLFIGAAAAALAPAGPGALVPLKMAIVSADSVGSDVYVAVVVDFGSGSTMGTVSKCVPVASNAHDADALAAAVNGVSYSDSGLLCAIDNYPSNGVQNCGQSVGSGDYDFWSYWHGSTGSWVYASDGPAEHSVSNPPDDVEGWRFQTDEPASSSDPPPGVAPTYAQICNASTEVPPSQASSPSTTTTTTNAPAASSTTPPTAGTSTTPGLSATTSTAVSTQSKSGRVAGATTTTTQAVSGKTTTTATSVSSGGTDKSGSQGSADTSRASLAAAASHKSSGGAPSGDLLPVILIGVVVAALGGFALLRWRRRPVEE